MAGGALMVDKQIFQPSNQICLTKQKKTNLQVRYAHKKKIKLDKMVDSALGVVYWANMLLNNST